MITNHYGHTVNSEKAITGVHSINDLNWDAYDYQDEICLDCEEAYADMAEEVCPVCMGDGGDWHEEVDGIWMECSECDGTGKLEGDYDIECDGSHTKLFGDWIISDKLDKEHDWFFANGHGYQPNKNGEYAAIMRETVIQVVWSKHTERHALCSPCYPNQGDADSDGEYLCYVLPKDMLWNEEN